MIMKIEKESIGQQESCAINKYCQAKKDRESYFFTMSTRKNNKEKYELPVYI